MYNGIGLQTPRGSGTNGYIQTNKFFVRPRPSSRSSSAFDAAATPDAIKKPNRDILEHDRKRRIELRLLSLQETLADQGYTDDEIAEKIAEARKAIEAEASAAAVQKGSRNSALPPPPKRFSDTQSHQIAARKEKQLETFRAALGIKRGELSSERELQEQNQIDQAHSLENEKNDDEKKDFGSQRINKKGNQLAEDVLAEKHSKDIKEHGTEKKHGSSHTNDPLEDGEFRSTKNTEEEGFKHEKGNKKVGTYDLDSDSYSRKKAEKYAKKQKRYENDSYSDPDSDRDARVKKKQAGKHVTKSRRHDLEDSKSDASDEMKSRRGLVDKHNKASKSGGDTPKRYLNKHKRRDSDSETDLDRYAQAKKKQVDKHTTKNRGYDSEDSISDASDERKIRRVPVEKHIKTNKSNSDTTKRYVKKQSNSDTDSDSDRDAQAKKTQVEKQANKSRRHESEDSKSDAADEKKSRRLLVEKHIKVSKTGGDTTKRYAKQHKKHDSDSYSDSDSDSDLDRDAQANKSRRVPVEKHIKTNKSNSDTIKRYVKKQSNSDTDSDSDRDAQAKKTQVEKQANKSRRHESEDSKSDAADEKKSRRLLVEKHIKVSKTGGDTTKRYVKQHKKHDSDSYSDSDSDFDRDARAKKKQADKHATKSRRYNSEDSKSDASDERKSTRELVEKYNTPNKSGGATTKRDVKKHREPYSDSDSDRDARAKKRQVEKHVTRSPRHDSEDLLSDDSESDSEKNNDRNDHHRDNNLKRSRLDYLQKTDKNDHFEPRRDSNDFSGRGSREERKRKVEDAEFSDVLLPESRRHLTEEEQTKREKKSRYHGSHGRSQEHARREDYPVDKYESRKGTKDERRYDDAKRRRYDDPPQYSTLNKYDRSYKDDSSQRKGH